DRNDRQDEGYETILSSNLAEGLPVSWVCSKGGENGTKGVGGKTQFSGLIEETTAVLCDDCQKWRKVPSSIAGGLPDSWVCSMNTWDVAFADCSVGEERFDEADDELPGASWGDALDCGVSGDATDNYIAPNDDEEEEGEVVDVKVSEDKKGNKKNKKGRKEMMSREVKARLDQAHNINNELLFPIRSGSLKGRSIQMVAYRVNAFYASVFSHKALEKKWRQSWEDDKQLNPSERATKELVIKYQKALAMTVKERTPAAMDEKGGDNVDVTADSMVDSYVQDTMTEEELKKLVNSVETSARTLGRIHLSLD
ncbi:hypothetical protein TrCOL_g4943, partial [Triparma columacea]